MNATTRFLLLACLSVTPLAAQGERLQRAILIEEQERNVKEAAKLYEEIAKAESTSAADRTVAWYRLGRALRRLGKNAEAQDAFEKAAAGKGPTAEAAKKLLGGADPRSEKERKLRASARALLEKQPSDMHQGLVWIGEAAVPEICARHERDWRAGNGSFAGLVWKIGGKRAEAFLRRALAESDSRFKETLMTAAPVDFHPELLEIALRFLEDESLSAKPALVLAKNVVHRAPWTRLATLTQSKRTGFASGLWGYLSTKLSRTSQTKTKLAAMKTLDPAIDTCLKGADPVVAAAAGHFLRTWGAMTRPSLQMILDRIDSWPRDVQLPYQTIRYTIDSRSLLIVARKLGPYTEQDNRTRWLQNVVESVFHHWQADEIETVLELTKHGYLLSFGRWMQASKGHVKHGVRIVEALADTKHLGEIATELSRVELDPSTFPTMLRWWNRFGTRRDEIFYCMGRTGADGALTFLSNALDDESARKAATYALMGYSMRKNNPELRDALRKTLRMSLESAPSSRVRDVFRRLVELGDLPCLRLLPKIDTFGLARSRSARRSHDRKHDIVRQLLSEWWDPGKNGIDSSHGYDAEGIAKAWSIVLDLDAEYWSTEMIPGTGYQRNTARLQFRETYHARPSVVRMLVEKLENRVAAAHRSGQPLHSRQKLVLGQILAFPGRWKNADDALIRSILALRMRCLKGGELSCRLAALKAVTECEAVAAERPELLRAFRDEDETIGEAGYDAIDELTVLSDAEFTDLIKTGGSFVRRMLLGSYLAEWKGDVALDAVVPSLTDGSEDVRIMVCKYLGRRADAGAVTPLLKVLRDPIEKVRDAARDALQDIRFYHEQEAHWERMFKGPRTDANSAAERLVTQAGAKEKKEVRLLAIRSLGLLGKVEVVPFLIDYSKEKDAEIAAAAKRAIAAIHAKAARGK